jgi:hypothetical protein
MQCAGQQPNQTGCWFSLPNKRQKHVTMVRPYPTRDTPTTTESFGFYNLITLPNNRQAFVPKTKTKIQSTSTIHNPYIYIGRNKLLKTQKWAKYLGMCRLDERAKSTSFDVRPMLGEIPFLRCPGGSRPVLWSRRERNRATVREGVGRSRESRPRGILGIRVLHFFTSQVNFRDFDFFLRLTMK